MQVYTVHEPERHADAVEQRADELVFVREGFSLAAFVLGPFWLAAKRLWLPLGGYIAALLALEFLFQLVPVSNAARAGIMLLASAGFALEANTLWRWGLERRGYRTIGAAVGQSFEECEHRFLTRWLADIGRPAHLGTLREATVAAAIPVPGLAPAGVSAP
jgi:Protein of unknown function (DUF2628)